MLGVFERKGIPREPRDAASPGAEAYDVLLFGLGRFGTAIGMRLKARGVRVLGVDFSPAAVQRWRELGLDAAFGDATDPEFVSELPLARASWLVSTVPVHLPGVTVEDARRTLIQISRLAGFSGRVAVASHNDRETRDLSDAGADVVLEPFQDAADRAADILCGGDARERTRFPAIPAEPVPG